MSTKRPLVIVTEGSDPAPLEWLKERAEVLEITPDDPRLDEELKYADGLVIRTYTLITPALLAKAPKLKVVARAGVGIDNIDVKACRARGVEVVHTPDANSLAVGDYVFGIILQLIRPWCRFKDHAYAPAEFKRVRMGNKGRQLDELTIGILGMGRVGKRVGRIAAAGFGMNVIYNDLLDVQSLLEFKAKPVDKPTLFREANILTIHIDMRAGNENLVGKDQIATMKKDAILINASRGEVLDAYALADAMREKRLFAAALDVYAPEPPPADFPLLGMENVILTPHMASRTVSAMENMAWVVKDVIAVLEGRKPQYPAP